MPYRTITYELDDHVALLTYNRPHQRNAISRDMNAELHDAWQRFRDDDDAFVLVLTGAGEAFCAGWDLEDAAEWPQGIGTASGATSTPWRESAAIPGAPTFSSR
jgi:enoyl-CoA hydratase/carnithine racemase